MYVVSGSARLLREAIYPKGISVIFTNGWNEVSGRSGQHLSMFHCIYVVQQMVKDHSEGATHPGTSIIAKEKADGTVAGISVS